jgi:hypothetical protein
MTREFLKKRTTFSRRFARELKNALKNDRNCYCCESCECLTSDLCSCGCVCMSFDSGRKATWTLRSGLEAQEAVI